MGLISVIVLMAIGKKEDYDHLNNKIAMLNLGFDNLQTKVSDMDKAEHSLADEL